MNTLEEVAAYWQKVYALKHQAPDLQAQAFAHTLDDEANTVVISDAMTTDQAQAWLATHGIDTQLVGGKVQAKDVWTKDGIVYEEWVVMTCELRWLRNWMNY